MKDTLTAEISNDEDFKRRIFKMLISDTSSKLSRLAGSVVLPMEQFPVGEINKDKEKE